MIGLVRSATGGRQARFSRRRVLRAAGLGGVAATAFAAGCSTGGRQKATSGASGSAATQARRGGTAHFRVAADPFDWDLSYAGKATPNIYGAITSYESLLSFKGGPGVAYADTTFVPKLATSWEVSPDATTFTFHLRTGVKFANLPPVNGRELTSDDVRFSAEYATRTGQLSGKNLPAGQFDFMYEGLQQIETPDPSLVTFRFNDPFVPFLAYAASNQNPILPHEIYDQYGNFHDHLIGTGPWQLDTSASQKGTTWVFKRNPTYWDAGKPYIDEADWLVVPDDAAAQAAFQTRQLDWFPAANAPTAALVSKASPGAVANEYLNPSPVHVYMQAQHPPFDDIRVRKAFALAIDRDEFVRVLSQGKGGWAMAGAFPDTFSQDEIKQMLKPDPGQAKQLLAAAGYANGLQIEFLLNQSSGQLAAQQAQLLQAQEKQVGINLAITPIDNNAYAQRKRDRKFNLMEDNKALQGEIDSYVYSTFYPGQDRNYTGVDDPKLTPLLVAQRREPDAAKRRQILRQAVQYINTEGYWAVALYYNASTEFWQPRLQNYAPSFGNESAGALPTWSSAIWLSA